MLVRLSLYHHIIYACHHTHFVFRSPSSSRSSTTSQVRRNVWSYVLRKREMCVLCRCGVFMSAGTLRFICCCRVDDGRSSVPPHDPCPLYFLVYTCHLPLPFPPAPSPFPSYIRRLFKHVHGRRTKAQLRYLDIFRHHLDHNGNGVLATYVPGIAGAYREGSEASRWGRFESYARYCPW